MLTGLAADRPQVLVLHRSRLTLDAPRCGLGWLLPVLALTHAPNVPEVLTRTVLFG